MENIKNIGKEIKEKRLSLNLTMDYVASKVGITRATLSSIENGSINCSLTNLINILDILDMKLNIDSNNKNISKRKRATRTNTLLEKKINEFIIMCIEEYGHSHKISSDKLYKKMLDKGIINDLHDDYEDLHGMSTIYLNDYISKLI